MFGDLVRQGAGRRPLVRCAQARATTRARRRTAACSRCAGDDPGAKSSSIAHQSEQALIHCGIPILNPSNVQDYLDLGLYGFALSRYSGCWIGFKCLTDTVESAGSV